MRAACVRRRYVRACSSGRGRAEVARRFAPGSGASPLRGTGGRGHVRSGTLQLRLAGDPGRRRLGRPLCRPRVPLRGEAPAPHAPLASALGEREAASARIPPSAPQVILSTRSPTVIPSPMTMSMPASSSTSSRYSTRSSHRSPGPHVSGGTRSTRRSPALSCPGASPRASPTAASAWTCPSARSPRIPHPISTTSAAEVNRLPAGTALPRRNLRQHSQVSTCHSNRAPAAPPSIRRTRTRSRWPARPPR